MAGGARRFGDHGTMAERVAATRRNSVVEEGAPAPVLRDGSSLASSGTVSKRPDLRHCWYAGPHGRQAALLIGWRRVSPTAGWEGHIAVAAPDDDGWSIVTLWVGAGMLEAA
ncbi:hypothetical protein [Nocardioides sp. Soil796]|uniref:hypothetical protein n=1 Tax=Nocardioides sp. Soil796 TaxID=1736412 RepID=UPI000A5E540A|nr:hypothetical protein [Nocardioides sp. Soil796]